MAPVPLFLIRGCRIKIVSRLPLQFVSLIPKLISSAVLSIFLVYNVINGVPTVPVVLMYFSLFCLYTGGSVSPPPPSFFFRCFVKNVSTKIFIRTVFIIINVLSYFNSLSFCQFSFEPPLSTVKAEHAELEELTLGWLHCYLYPYLFVYRLV